MMLDRWIANVDDPGVRQQLQELRAGDETAVRDASTRIGPSAPAGCAASWARGRTA